MKRAVVMFEFFQWQWVRWFMFDPLIETRMIQPDIWYVRISNFGSQKVVDEFYKAFDLLDLTIFNGIIPDVEVIVTQQDIIRESDPVLNKGIDVIRNWGKYKN